MLHLIACHGRIMPRLAELLFIFEPVHNKTYNKSCVTSKDSDQCVHPPSMSRVLLNPSPAEPGYVLLCKQC